MSSILFLNEFLEPISEQQAGHLSSHVKHFVENGFPKKTENYDGKNLSSVHYYLDTGETEAAIRAMYPGIAIGFFKNKVTQGAYSKYDYEVIDANGILIEKRIQVFGDSLFPVYDKSFDLQTNQVHSFSKHYYGPHNVTYEFEYDLGTGEFERLTVSDPGRYYDTDQVTLYPADIGIGLNPYGFSWQGFEYYQHADPVLPL